MVICEIIDTRALAAPGSRHALLRYRANSLNSLIGPSGTVFWVLDNAFPPEVRERSKLYAQDNIMILPNKSELWFGGLDDPKRVDKILGTEFATLYFNESSQLPYASVTTALTRLAQVVKIKGGPKDGQVLRQKAFFDANPPPESHWLFKLFERHIDPLSGRPLADPENYLSMLMNPEGNRENLDPKFLEALERLPERQRKRFYLGQYGDAGEAALWTSETVDAMRIDGVGLPQFVRIVIPVDPSGADNAEDATADEIGIGAIALGTDGVAYVLEDLTMKGSPAEWGRVAVEAYHRHMANCIVGEANFGGAMVRHVIHTAVDAEGSPIGANVPYKEVVASRGKHIRAEPVSALSEAGKVKLVGRFQQLEDEMCSMTTAGYTGTKSPNRLDWLVWGVTELFPKIIQQSKVEQTTISHGVRVGYSSGGGPRVNLGHSAQKAGRARR